MIMHTYMMNLLAVGCYLSLVLGSYGVGIKAVRAQTNDDWKLEKDKDQIQIYSRRLPNSKLSELKIECTMPGTQNQLVALLSDITNYENVIYKMKSAKLVKRVSETELVYYGVSALPWPVSDRDMAVRLTFNYVPAAKILYIKGVDVPNLVAARPGRVRITNWLANWQVRQATSNQMQITYTVRFDPGGDIPAWLDNVAASASAFQSFSLLRESIQLPRYQGKSFDFLQ